MPQLMKASNRLFLQALSEQRYFVLALNEAFLVVINKSPIEIKPDIS